MIFATIHTHTTINTGAIHALPQYRTVQPKKPKTRPNRATANRFRSLDGTEIGDQPEFLSPLLFLSYLLRKDMGLSWFLNSAHTLASRHSSDDRIQTQEPALSLERAKKGVVVSEGFQVPVHYPRYKKEDYEKMEEWKIDLLFRQYGLGFKGSLEEKRSFAIGEFLWPDQLS